MKNLLGLVALLMLTSCRAQGSSITIPVSSTTINCPTCVTPSSPSPLVWTSTPTWTAPMQYVGSSLDNAALDLFTGDGTGAATYEMSLLGGFELSNTADQDGIVWDLRSYLDGQGRGVNIIMRNIGGTQAAPTATTSDMKSTISMRGFGTSNSPLRAAVDMGAGENWTGSAQGTYFAWTATANGTTSTTEKMRLTGNGNLGVGTTAPGAKVEVASGTLAVDGAGAGIYTSGNIIAGGTISFTGNVQAGWVINQHDCGAGVTNCSVACGAGTFALGGGCQSDQLLKASYPNPDGGAWNCDTNVTPAAFVASVICARIQ